MKPARAQVMMAVLAGHRFQAPKLQTFYVHGYNAQHRPVADCFVKAEDQNAALVKAIKQLKGKSKGVSSWHVGEGFDE